MEWKYNRPARRWGEADPLGNGHMGAMMYGGVVQERIDLSEVTFFSGASSPVEDNQKGAPEAFLEMRRYASQEDFANAAKAAERFIGRRNNYGTNLPVGTLWIDMSKEEDTKEGFAKGNWDGGTYERSLDFQHGIWGMSWENCRRNKISAGEREVDSRCAESHMVQWIKRESFLSWVDKALVCHMESDCLRDYCIRFQPHNSWGSAFYENGQLIFTAKARETMHSDGSCGVNLTGRMAVVTDGLVIGDNTISAEDNQKMEGICIKGASRVCLYLSMETDFGRNESLERLDSVLKDRLAYCVQKGWQRMKQEHREDVCEHMGRCLFRLDTGNPQRDEREAGMFAYGRYLLLASSREDSRLPAHLQGAWNDNVACRIGWTCDMHLDINTQMNYWPAETTGLSECSMPLFRWIEEILIPMGRISAKESYGLPGWAGEIVSNAWGFAAPYWAAPIAPCPTGGLWILSHMWEHGWYHEDQVFVRNRAWPAMREAARFFLAYVFETEPGSGFYTCGPSISPENSFVKEGRAWQISNGCTYELLMIRELFEQLIKVEQFLQVSSPERKEAERLLSKLLPYRVLEDGTLAEWGHDFPAADPQHRHQSHLLGVYPFSQITPEKTPDLADAAFRSMERRLFPEENWEDTGWARSMMLLYSARLKDGAVAYRHLNQLLTGLLEENHMIIHPPTRGAGSFDNVYELDGNTGYTSGVAELLLQSHGNGIELLPALPPVWSAGEICGLRARGGFTLSFGWAKSKVQWFSVMGTKGTECRVCCNGQEFTQELTEDTWKVEVV